MKKRIEDAEDLRKIVEAALKYDIVLFKALRMNSEYVQKVVAINADFDVVRKEFFSEESKSDLKNWFVMNGYYEIGDYSISYNPEENIILQAIQVKDNLSNIAQAINNSRERRESSICVPNVNIITAGNNSILRKARDFASFAHDGQARLDGTEFVCHPRRVADNIRKFYSGKFEVEYETAGHLHDTAEDTPVTIADIEENFGTTVAGLVLELTSDDMMKHKLGKAVYLTQKMLKMSDGALLIKLCDRLDNISDLNNTSPEFRKRYSKETLEILENLLIFRKLNIYHLRVISEILVNLAKLKDLDKEKSASIKRLNLKVVEKYSMVR